MCEFKAYVITKKISCKIKQHLKFAIFYRISIVAMHLNDRCAECRDIEKIQWHIVLRLGTSQYMYYNIT